MKRPDIIKTIIDTTTIYDKKSVFSARITQANKKKRIEKDNIEVFGFFLPNIKR